VEAILDAVVRILKRQGVDAVTTNRIAEVAGVSVGSVYQYFPDKGAIFVALHDRHAEQMGRLVDKAVVEHAGAPAEEMIAALVDALVDAHARDPELFALLDAEVPHRAGGERALETHLRNALRLALAPRSRDLERTLFVVPVLVDALAHAAALHRPARMSLEAAKREAGRAIRAYLRVTS